MNKKYLQIKYNIDIKKMITFLLKAAIAKSRFSI